MLLPTSAARAWKLPCPEPSAVYTAAQGGDLRNALWRELHEGTHEFDWYNKGRDVAIAVARGLNFLHKNHVVHRCGSITGAICDETIWRLMTRMLTWHSGLHAGNAEGSKHLASA